MKQDAFLAAELTDSRNVLNHTDLVVDIHHRDQHGVGPNRRGQDLPVDQAIFVDIKIGDLESFALQFPAGVERGLVFRFHGNDVAALVFVEMSRPFDGQIDGFSCARSPDNLFCITVHQRGYMLARSLYGLFGLPAIGMAARGGITKILAQVRQHDIHDPWINRCGGGVVEIDRCLH